MEQAIWVWIGILATIIGVSVLVNAFRDHTETLRVQTLQNDVGSLEQQCRFTCREEPGTKYQASLTVYPGTRVWTTTSTICTSYNEETICANCPCTLKPNEVMNITNEAQTFFTQHTYSCTFSRGENLTVSCQG